MDIAFAFLFYFYIYYFTAAKGKLQQKPAGIPKNSFRRADFIVKISAFFGEQDPFCTGQNRAPLSEQVLYPKRAER